MFYHVIIETNEKTGKPPANRVYIEYDKTNEEEIVNTIINPYLNKEQIQFDGYFLSAPNIVRIAIKQTEKSSLDLVQYENDNMPSNVLVFVRRDQVIQYPRHSTDCTKELFQMAKSSDQKVQQPINTTKQSFNKVFIVHGQDELAKNEVARFLEKLDLEPIILHEQVSKGMTIIEKIEHYSDVGFGIVLYTPCDEGNIKGSKDMNPRARQNVVFEHGYLIGKLKRENVCALVKEKVETPNDISGIVYIPMDTNKAWSLIVAKELKNAGYTVDMNKL